MEIPIQTNEEIDHKNVHILQKTVLQQMETSTSTSNWVLDNDSYIKRLVKDEHSWQAILLYWKQTIDRTNLFEKQLQQLLIRSSYW